MRRVLGTDASVAVFAAVGGWWLIAGMLLAIGPAAAQSGPGGYGHRMGDGMWHGWFPGPGMTLLVMLAVFALGLAIGRAGSRRRGDASPGEGESGPRQILAERFARGEIDEAEFRQRTHALDL